MITPQINTVIKTYWKKRLRRSLRRFILFFAIPFFTFSCQSPSRFVDINTDTVHIFEMTEIGGIEQGVMINGKKKSNPVLVFLHGGPGYPMLPFEPYSRSMKRLERHYTIVYWEQRGTGISYHPDMSKEEMNVERFVKDTDEVIEYAKRKLGKEKVFLWGHSWGTNIGAIYASRFPENLHAYIATGQSVDPFRNERLGYEFVLKKAKKENNKKALKDLSLIDTIPENYALDDALTLRKWIYKYGGIVHSNENRRPYVDLNEIKTILLSPIYPLRTRINLVKDPYFSAINLWDDLKNIDLLEQAPKIDVPVYFLTGRHDIIVSYQLAEEYYEKLKAPSGKTLIWFNKSAHRPFYEETNKFLSIMTEKIIRETDYKGK